MPVSVTTSENTRILRMVLQVLRQNPHGMNTAHIRDVLVDGGHLKAATPHAAYLKVHSSVKHWEKLKLIEPDNKKRYKALEANIEIYNNNLVREMLSHAAISNPSIGTADDLSALRAALHGGQTAPPAPLAPATEVPSIGEDFLKLLDES